ncbi:MAG: ribonuclease III [Pseudomonadales bacterium]
MPNNNAPLIRRLGYDFRDLSLVDLALSHCSVGGNNNERMEFLGDSIVNFIIGEALYQKFPGSREGELSQMRAQLVKGVTLAEIAREFNLGDYLNLGPGELKSGGFRRESILADTVEALIGAIYLDGGMEICRERVLTWYASRLEKISSQLSNKDAKSQLQEWLQSRKKDLPRYHLVETTGNPHQQQFKVECEISFLKLRFHGSGSNRRAAEQVAAQVALNHLQEKI